jgi:Kef-type K+ transport system membrane component KefB
VFVVLLLSALATEAIGIHAIFGASLLGAVIPANSGVARGLSRQLESVVTVLLLPSFFAFTGMRTRIDLLSGVDQWLICAMIILVATAGKFGGTVAAARLTGWIGAAQWHWAR